MIVSIIDCQLQSLIINQKNQTNPYFPWWTIVINPPETFKIAQHVTWIVVPSKLKLVNPELSELSQQHTNESLLFLSNLSTSHILLSQGKWTSQCLHNLNLSNHHSEKVIFPATYQLKTRHFTLINLHDTCKPVRKLLKFTQHVVASDLTTPL